jgi:hypothetical protein
MGEAAGRLLAASGAKVVLGARRVGRLESSSMPRRSARTPVPRRPLALAAGRRDPVLLIVRFSNCACVSKDTGGQPRIFLRLQSRSRSQGDEGLRASTAIRGPHRGYAPSCGQMDSSMRWTKEKRDAWTNSARIGTHPVWLYGLISYCFSGDHDRAGELSRRSGRALALVE